MADTKVRANNEIRAKTIRLIGADGEMIGVVSLEEGLRLAAEAKLDLLEISPNAEPPVCKILNYGKYKYMIQKKENEAKKKQKISTTKEIKIRHSIAEADYMVKLRSAEKFLKNGDKVRISLIFKGREIAHNELGFGIMERFKEDILLFGAKIDVEPKMEGRQIFMVIAPK